MPLSSIPFVQAFAFRWNLSIEDFAYLCGLAMVQASEIELEMEGKTMKYFSHIKITSFLVPHQNLKKLLRQYMFCLFKYFISC